MNAISVKYLHKSFGDNYVLANLNWEIEAGSVVGLLGRNGVGKSTLLRCLLGLSRPDKGEIRVFGEPADQLPDACKQRIGYVPQTSSDFSWMKVRDVLTYIGAFYPSWQSDRVFALARRWEVDMDQRLSELSEGQRQKVSILRALGHDPDLLVLDEPVAALDPIARREFISELLELTFQEGKTIIFSTHITSDLERIAADVSILKSKRITLHSAIDEIKEQVVRLRVNGQSVDQLKVPGTLSVRRESDTAVFTVKGFSDSLMKRIQRQGFHVVLERLNLEEIFMELDR